VRLSLKFLYLEIYIPETWDSYVSCGSCCI